MKAIILAAGYATRLFPLTQDFPKPLININKKPMIDYIIEKIDQIGIQDIYVVTNDKYYQHFQKWSQTHPNHHIEVINDNTLSNEDRLGAIGDIQYTIEQKNINEDLFVIGGDNLFQFSLTNSFELFKKTKTTTIIGYDVQDRDLAKKYGIIAIDDNNKVTSFVEKPANPASTLAAICVYYYPQHMLPKIKQYLDEGNNKDAPGNLPAWLVNKDGVYAQVHNKHRYDVGDFHSLKAAKEEFGETDVDIEKLKQGL